ncbi:protease [Streptomyces spiroverticillatus]|uniref:Protease n=1 Tax=Streptomyces finlayi TaxID=67296 RepID=A0A919C833_9ACTN|nr:trypsin-like peptidase domain-containing protein [Streptomyces finlayi]GGZ97293.1 protease [Streptomyces spiroverticillatus]GHC82458.1 protease [Streptomyces finlayi]
MNMTNETPRPSGEHPEHPAQAQYAGFPPPPAHAPTAHKRRAGRPVALLAAVAVVAATFGGGAAYLTQRYTGDTGTGGSLAAPGSNVSQSSMGTVSGVAQAVGPAIVEISARSTAGQSTGSGVIITSDGEVVTNNHVIAGADTVKVKMSDGKTYTAKVVGTDPDKDLALLKIQGAKNLPTAKLGNSKDVKVGDQVVAIGSPEGLSGTVTSGIVSALDRDVTVSKEQPQQQRGGGGGWPFEFGGEQFNGDTGQSKTTYKALQTDASLNPGNSGGALINMRGEIIGINSAMYAPSSGGGSSSGSVGLGFAIPVDTVKADLDSLRKGGSGDQQQAPEQQDRRGGGLIGGLGV